MEKSTSAGQQPLSGSAKVGRQQAGDRNAARGHAFEHPLRAEILIGLRDDESLVYFRHEDAEVMSPRGRTYYQFRKRSGKHKSTEISKLVRNFEIELSRDPLLTVQLWSDKDLPDPRPPEWSDLEKTYGRKRVIFRRVPSLPDEEWNALAAFVLRRLMEEVPEADVKQISHAQFMEIAHRAEREVVRLIDQADRYGRPVAHPAIDGATAQRKIGFTRLRDGLIASLARGLMPWNEWQRRAENPDLDRELAGVQDALTAPYSIETLKEREILALLRAWLVRISPPESTELSQAPDGNGGRNLPRQHVLAVKGANGTGKSWLLARLGRSLAAVMPDRVFAVSDPDAFVTADLEKLAKVMPGCVVIADDLDADELFRPLLNACRSDSPLSVICGFVTDDDERVLQQLGKHLVTFELPRIVRHEDRGHLVAALRKSETVAWTEKEALSQGTLRSAVRLLRDSTTDEHVVDELIQQWQNPAAMPWMSALLVTSRLSVRLPMALLSARVRAQAGSLSSMPPSVEAYVLRRTPPHLPAQAAEARREELIWLDGSDLAREALKRLPIPESVAELVENEVHGLIAVLDIRSPSQRRTLRRLLKRLPAGEQSRLLKEYADVVLRATRDAWFDASEPPEVWAQLLTKLPLARQPEVDKLLRELFKKRPPASLADLLLLSGPDVEQNSAERFIAAVRDSQAEWRADLWAEFIERVAILNDDMSRQLGRRGLPLLMAAHVPSTELFQIRNVASQLGRLAARHGTPTTRAWVLECLMPLLGQVPPERTFHAAVPAAVELTTRVVMQPRYGVALRFLAEDFHAGARALQKPSLSLAADYEQLYADEQNERFAPRTLDSLRELVRGLSDQPTHANQVWPHLLAFDNFWGELEGRAELASAALAFVRGHMLNGLLLRHVYATRNSALISAGTYPVMTEEDGRLFLQHYSRPREHVSWAQSYLVFLGAVSRTWPALSGPGSVLLNSLVRGNMKGQRRAAAAHLAAVAETVQYQKEPLIAPEAIFYLDKSGQKLARSALYRSLRILPPSAEEEHRSFAEDLHERFRHRRAERYFLASALVRLGAPDLARASLGKEVVSPATATGWAWSALLHALELDVSRCRVALGNMARTYLDSGRGAHPIVAFWALQATAAILDDEEAEEIQLCSRLCHGGPLVTLSRSDPNADKPASGVVMEPEFSEGLDIFP